MTETDLAGWQEKESRRQQAALAELEGRLEALTSRVEGVATETGELARSVERLLGDSRLLGEMEESLSRLRRDTSEQLDEMRTERERPDRERIDALETERLAREFQRLEEKLKDLPNLAEQVKGVEILVKRLEERLSKAEAGLPPLAQRLGALEEHNRLLERRLAGETQRDEEWEALRGTLLEEQSGFAEEQKGRFQDVQRTLRRWQEEMAELRKGWDERSRELKRLLDSAARVPKLFTELETLRTQFTDDRRQVAQLMEVMEERRQRGLEGWQAGIESRLSDWSARQEQAQREGQKWRETFEKDVYDLRERQQRLQRALDELLKMQQEGAQRQLEEMRLRVGQMEERFRALNE